MKITRKLLLYQIFKMNHKERKYFFELLQKYFDIEEKGEDYYEIRLQTNIHLFPIQVIRKNIDKNINVSITYFVADQMKSGGEYISKKGTVKKLNEYSNLFVMDDNTEIPILDVLEIIIE